VSIRDWLRGPVVAVPTPFHDDYSLDLDGLGANLREIVGRGVTRGDGVLLVAGAPGEFPALTPDERKGVIWASLAAA
jgi:dihydrodipicolinate synthase/N-acetylneuraminate lyase